VKDEVSSLNAGVHAAHVSCKAAHVHQVLLASVAFAILASELGGCAALRKPVSTEPAGPASCSTDPKHMTAVPIESALSLSADELACYGDELRVDCGFLHGITVDDRNACEIYVRAVVTHLERNRCLIVKPSTTIPISYKDQGVCIDTFIPGREAEDCFDFIEASIRLEPVPPNTSLDRKRER